jgi:hypothetical protein
MVAKVYAVVALVMFWIAIRFPDGQKIAESSLDKSMNKMFAYLKEPFNYFFRSNGNKH